MKKPFLAMLAICLFTAALFAKGKRQIPGRLLRESHISACIVPILRRVKPSIRIILVRSREQILRIPKGCATTLALPNSSRCFHCLRDTRRSTGSIMLRSSTRDVEALKAYLGTHGIAVPATAQRGSDGSRWFDVKDPEDNNVEFVQLPSEPSSSSSRPPQSSHHPCWIYGSQPGDRRYFLSRRARIQALLVWRPEGRHDSHGSLSKSQMARIGWST